jgi:glucose-1-phosphate thymidylyltransferase
MKGIVLAGGTGSRLHPITGGVSKQLLPVFDKPLIYYPLSVLMLAGIREILVVTTPESAESFRRLLGDGSQWGISLTYVDQPRPEGLAQAIILGEAHIGDDDVALILGDNIFYGQGFPALLRRAVASLDGCVLFGYRVRHPQRYGVGRLDVQGRLVSIDEKPANPRSDLAITGLYLYDRRVVEMAQSLTPSARGELEITDLNNLYLADGTASLIDLGRGFAWLDTGTHESLLDAGTFVRVLENRQGIRISCLEEIALGLGFIDAGACFALGEANCESPYGQYVMAVARAAGGG